MCGYVVTVIDNHGAEVVRETLPTSEKAWARVLELRKEHQYFEVKIFPDGYQETATASTTTWVKTN